MFCPSVKGPEAEGITSILKLYVEAEMEVASLSASTSYTTSLAKDHPASKDSMGLILLQSL